jgi:L-asparagine transporter-like permease
LKNPVKSIRNSGGLALITVANLYILANVAYFSAVPKEELVEAKQTAASLFFSHVFGSGRAVRGLNFLIALSAFGNLVTVLLGQSRLIRECGRYVNSKLISTGRMANTLIQSRNTPLSQLLGQHTTIRYTIGSISLEMGLDVGHDHRSASRGCVCMYIDSSSG